MTRYLHGTIKCHKCRSNLTIEQTLYGMIADVTKFIEYYIDCPDCKTPNVVVITAEPKKCSKCGQEVRK